MAIREAGSLKNAAELLGMNYNTLRSHVAQDPELKSKYTKPRKGRKGAKEAAKRIDEPVSQDNPELGSRTPAALLEKSSYRTREWLKP